ncbi:MAG: hypothetical protein ACE14M_14130 [Terriglobales bacterium]
MSRLISKFLVLAIVLLTVVHGSAAEKATTAPAAQGKAATTATAKKSTPTAKRKSKHSKRHTRPQQPYNIAPMTPELLPAAPPQVSYLNGQLTIQSENSTLADILAAVRNRTGADVDLPPGFGSERVATRLGPGPACDVLNSLLSGSKFGYVLVGAPGTPGAVQRVIVTGEQSPLSASSASPAANENERRRGERKGGRRQAPPRGVPAEPEPQEETVEIEPEPPAPTEPAQPPVPAPAAVPAPNASSPNGQPAVPFGTSPPASAPEAQSDQSTQTPGQPPVKTPEQLLQELQQMRKQGQAPPQQR